VNLLHRAVYIIGLTGILFLFSCGNEPANSGQHPISQMGWLVGKWQGETETGDFYEEWRYDSKTALSGSGYEVSRDGDTTLSENIKIEQDYDNIYYKVEIGPDKRQVKFKLTKIASDRLVFSNPKNNFPSTIEYYSPDKMKVVITLTGNDTHHKPQTFTLVKTF